MIYYECKKIFSMKNSIFLCLTILLSSVIFWVQMAGIKNGDNTKKLEQVYDIIRNQSLDEAERYLEGEKTRIQDTLAREQEMAEKYRKGELDADSYLQYRNQFHECEADEEVTAIVYERVQKEKDTSGRMVLDLYYNRLFEPGRIPWGLYLCVTVFAVFSVTCEKRQLLSALEATAYGKRGLWQGKGIAVLLFCLAAGGVESCMEFAIYRYFYPFCDLSAPVQSIQNLSEIRIPVSIAGWMVIHVGRNLLASMMTGMCVFGGGYMGKGFCRGRKLKGNIG